MTLYRATENENIYGTLQASITIEPEALHDLPRTQYGHSLEHLGKCINGGIWAEGESPDMFLGGVRRELVEAIKSIHPALIRYPGGCFADSYHWQDGIGPRAGRPTVKNKAWNRFPYLGKHFGPMEDNHFGTDEFLKLSEEMGAEAQLTVNVGSGTAEEAAAWVEYCNGPQDSRWGALRARNGHPHPYGVKYWSLGNEMFSFFEIGHMTPDQYVRVFNEYAHAMRRADPKIKLIGCGTMWPSPTQNNANPILLAAIGRRDDINRTVLEGAGNEMDYLSMHLYGPSNFFTVRYHVLHQFLHREQSSSRKVYYDIICSLPYMEKFVAGNAMDVRAYSPSGKKISLAFDEWNLWYAFYSDVIETNFNLRDGLWVASMLNMFHRHAPDMPIANISQMVNCIGIICSSRLGTFLTPSALVFRMYTEHAGKELLPSRVECPALPHETELPVLDLSATRTGDRVSLFFVNRHYDMAVNASCRLPGIEVVPPVRFIEMAHPNPVQYNTLSEPEAVRIRENHQVIAASREGSGSSFEVLLPPHSLTCIEMNVKKR
jgi:alpha-L-arabinofuranosidase